MVRDNFSIWQLACGTADRTYDDLLIKYGVALVGPGDTGAWNPGRSDEEFGNNNRVRTLAQEISIGDVLVLRTARESISAVGVVVSDYQYLVQFDDLNGWDLQHARRVLWSRKEHTFSQYVFGGQPSAINQVYKQEVQEFVYQFVEQPPREWQEESLPPLPRIESELKPIPKEHQEIISRIQHLGAFYYNADENQWPSERELVAHCVIPFLRSLGWPDEQIAIEWNIQGSKVDVCVFTKPSRTSENCHFLVEAKWLGAGLERWPFVQAVEYASKIGVHRVVVTDGIRYRMYEASAEKHPENFNTEDFGCVAYANLWKLKNNAMNLFNLMRNPLQGKS